MDNLQLFKEYKLKGEELVSKITTFGIERYRNHITEIAKKFEIPIKHGLYECEDDELIYMTMDYFFHEHKIEGKTIIEMYEESETDIDDFEKEFIRAMKESYASLYRVVNTSKHKGYVFIMDLFNKVTNSKITDEELVQIVDDNNLLFLRMYKFKDLNMTMNTMYIYDNKYEEFIMKCINDVLKIGKKEEITFNLYLSMNEISNFMKQKSS